MLDPKDTVALHGAGVAYLTLENVPCAVKMLDRAYAMNPKDRAIVHNLASALSRTDQLMRGIKLLRDQLAANPAVFDEPMLDALGISLDLATPTQRKNKNWIEAQKFYETYTAKLEAKRPGYRRWGSEWKSAAEVAAMEKENGVARAKMVTIDRQINGIDGKIVAIKKGLPQIEWRVKCGWDDQKRLDNELAKLKALNEDRANAVASRTAAEESIVKSGLPAEVGVVMINSPVPALAALPPKPTDVAVQTPADDGIDDPSEDAGATSSAKPPVVAPTEPPVVTPLPTKQEKRIVTRYAVGFAVTDQLLTVPAAAVAGAMDVTVQGSNGFGDTATVVRSDDHFALVKLNTKQVKALKLGTGAFAGGAVKCVGLPHVDLFQASPESITGKADAPAGAWKVKLDKHPRLSGAPLLSGDAVVGVTFAGRDDEPSAIAAIDLHTLMAFLADDAARQTTFAADATTAVF